MQSYTRSACVRLFTSTSNSMLTVCVPIVGGDVGCNYVGLREAVDHQLARLLTEAAANILAQYTQVNAMLA